MYFLNILLTWYESPFGISDSIIRMSVSTLVFIFFLQRVVIIILNIILLVFLSKNNNFFYILLYQDE